MSHKCHAINCEVEVPPTMHMCLKHWRLVPREIQKRIWKHYRLGQCDDKRVSKEYIKAAFEAKRFIRQKELANEQT
jgi:hypothetical protein